MKISRSQWVKKRLEARIWLKREHRSKATWETVCRKMKTRTIYIRDYNISWCRKMQVCELSVTEELIPWNSSIVRNRFGFPFFIHLLLSSCLLLSYPSLLSSLLSFLHLFALNAGCVPGTGRYEDKTFVPVEFMVLDWGGRDRESS